MINIFLIPPTIIFIYISLWLWVNIKYLIIGNIYLDKIIDSFYLSLVWKKPSVQVLYPEGFCSVKMPLDIAKDYATIFKGKIIYP